MGSKGSKLAQQVARSQQHVLSPRERATAANPSTSPDASPLRHSNRQGAMQGIAQKDQDKFRNDWFPNIHWEQYPVRGDVEQMAEHRKSSAPITADPDPSIPWLAEEADNKEIIEDYTFIGRGMMPGPDKSTLFPRLHRDENKMPKSRVSLPEKKLKGYLDSQQYKEVYEIADNYTLQDLAVKFETQEKQLQDILSFTAWVEQPAGSTLHDSKRAMDAEDRLREKEANTQNAARLHQPNQGGQNAFEGRCE